MGQQRDLATIHASRTHTKLMFIATALAHQLAIATLVTSITFTARSDHVAVIGRTEIITLAISSTLFAVFTLFA